MEIAAFIAAIDPASPSGADLRNDARFHSLENRLEVASRPARLRLIEGGGTGAVDLNWTELLEDATALAQSGRDLRLLVIVARLLTNDRGLAGLIVGLDLLTQTVTQFWDSLHPALRDAPSKREAALRRINALYQLENPDGGVLGDLEFTTLLSPRGLGPVTGGDLAAAALTRNAYSVEAPKGLGDKELAALLDKHEARLNRVTVACRATAAERPDEMASLKADLDACRAGLAALEAALAPHVTENGVAVRFDSLGKMLARIGQTLEAGGDTAPATPAMTEVSAMPADPTPMRAANGAAPVPSAPAHQSVALPGQLHTRRDVERCLDLVIDFYERTEPSSPIPHLARRMRKMVPMNFMQLMEEIAPSGLKEFRGVAGVFEDKK